jgi:ParB family chromosome partitioning protein
MRTPKLPSKVERSAAAKPNQAVMRASATVAKKVAQGGRPLNLDMDLIDEDPNQPRTDANPGFSNQSLDEMAASITLRGVKTPISVRENPDKPGRFLINHGARRYRGSKRAGKTSIPGFIDNDYNKADQVVENLHRNELTAREIADYIGIELARGLKKKEIADQVSKSASFITQHATLLDLPDPVAKVFNAGRANDVTAINELCTAFKKNPKEVTTWLESMDHEVTREEVKGLREFLEYKRAGGSSEGHPELLEEHRGTIKSSPGANDGDANPGAASGPAKLRNAIVQVRHRARNAHLILTRRPTAEGLAWLKYEDDGDEFEAKLTEVALVALLTKSAEPARRD